MNGKALHGQAESIAL